MTKITMLHIQGVGGIEDLTINFNDNMNIICGPNGIGKTTILECLAQTFSNHYNNLLRKKADHESGKWEVAIDTGEKFMVSKLNFHPDDPQAFAHPLSLGTQYASKIISIKTNRTFDYMPLHSISKDAKNDGNSSLVHGMGISDVKNWFVSRHLWSKHDDALTHAQQLNLEYAKSIFHKIDPEVSFSRVKGGTNDILLNQKDNSEIYFEYLSSGYKSLIFIILGLIKEIEIRFSDDNLLISDFDGVVLIDEIDLHLHPKWQSNLVYTLKEIFPRVQFITSTHSSHVIQATAPDEIIPLGRDSNERVIIREVSSSKHGFQGWTVEEILLDVMGLEETRSPLFIKYLNDFELALENDNFEDGKKAFEVLDEMIHPNNHLRKLLKLQLGSLGSDMLS